MEVEFEPNSFPDVRGKICYVGSHVAYATRVGDVAALRLGYITAIKGTNRRGLKAQIEVNHRKRWVECLHNIVKLEG